MYYYGGYQGYGCGNPCGGNNGGYGYGAGYGAAVILVLFILLAITNFRTWYIMWLFGIFTQLETRDVNKVIALTLISEFSNYIVYYLGEGYIFGGYYFIMTVITFALYCVAGLKLILHL